MEFQCSIHGIRNKNDVSSYTSASATGDLKVNGIEADKILNRADFTMETNRKHIPPWNSDVEDRQTVNVFKCKSSTNFNVENNSIAHQGQKAKNYGVYDGGRTYSRCQDEHQDLRLSVNDDEVCLHSVNDWSITNPLLCEMERSNSWKFLSYSERVRSFATSSSNSSSSSLESCSEFNRILSSILSSKRDPNLNYAERSKSFLTFNRQKFTSLRRSFSTSGRDTQQAQFQKLSVHGKHHISHSVPDDVRNYCNTTECSHCYSDSEFSSGEEYCSRKRRKIINENAVDRCGTTGSFEDELWNRLALESYPVPSNVADDALLMDAYSVDECVLPRQRLGKRSASASSIDDDAGRRKQFQQPRQLQQQSAPLADVKFQRMRSSSVTLRRECTSPWPAVGLTRLQRSYSIATMVVPSSGKCVTESNPRSRSSTIQDESFRPLPHSWIRASMRFVRPFQLADPPTPSRRPSVSNSDPCAAASAVAVAAATDADVVQIQFPPLFPCDVLDRPRSAPVSDRPRQYGRCGQRRVIGQASSVSSSSSLPAVATSSSSSRVVPAAVLIDNRVGVQSGRGGSDSDCDSGGRSGRSDRVGRSGDRDADRASGSYVSSRGGRRSSNSTANVVRSSNAAVSSTHRAHLSRRRESGPGFSSTASARAVPSASGTYEMSQESESPLGQWNHGLSSMLACLGCTLGIFNISRFAIFSIHFGANFIFQFLVLTVLIGIPLFTFHISLGQLLGTGVLNMWHISPIFKGIGIALLLSQAFIGVYSIIGVSWMFVYFRDSFISKQDVYRWAEPLELYGEDGVRTLKYNNGSYKIEQTVPDYFGGVVLQRRNVLKQEEDLMNVKFSVAFNLAIVWIIIFLSLSKGLKSYGKIVYIFSVLPIFGMTLLCAKLLGFLPNTSKSHNFFSETDWSEFFLNSKSWVAAFTEVFLTWGVFGASAMQITSHNRQKHYLYRDSALVIFITVSVLLLSAFIANMCSQLLGYNNFLYLPSSFERSATYIFLQRMDIPLPYSYATTPIRWMSHSGLILGERTMKLTTNVCQESGYQPLRLATELVPATFAAMGPKNISPFWSVLFYFVFIMFGIAQQLAIWYGIISNIVSINAKVLKPCWTTIAWFTCIGGFVMGLPLTTESGIFVVYFMDYVVGCGWWIMILYLLQLGAVFIVRGRPYSGETIVATLFVRSNYFLQNWIAPMFSFNWNVILPVTLLLLSTSVFKNGGYRMLYNWHSPKFYEYWPQWSRKFGCFLQVLPLCLIPLVGIIQSYLYLTDGPVDLFERIQMLYRPVVENASNLHNLNSNDVESNNRNNNSNSNNSTVTDDPPPKYTPPPSYSTATGARIAKLLRQSFRRSVIRIAHALGNADATPSTSDNHQTIQRPLPPPPDYSTVLVEINQSRRCVVPTANSSAVVVTVPDGNLPNEQSPSTLTALDVANILRSSLGRNRILPSHINSSSISNSCSSNSDSCNNLVEQECTSIQCLVDSAVPINQDSITLNDLKSEEQPI